MFNIFKVFAALFLVFLNGFFVLAEFSIVKISRTRLEELASQGIRQAKLALKIVTSMDSYLSAIQLGITLSSLALGWIGEPAVSSLIRPIIEPITKIYLPESDWLVPTMSIIIGFIIITLLHVVLGELIPKSLAINNTEKMALVTVWPLYIFHKIGYPVIVLFDKTAWFILKLMGIKRNPSDSAHSEEELRMLVNASHQGGVLDEMESEIIDNVFDFADRLAREIMVPRQDMICLFTDDTFEENMQVVRQTGHTRYPLCEEDKDHVLGMIHLRDLVNGALDVNGKNKDLKNFVREILVVPEAMPVAQLLQVMRRKRTHLAVVADEYGGTAGMVAMEDVIEEIIGDIQDEHDKVLDFEEIQLLPDGSYEFDGIVLMDEVIELLNLQLEEHEEDTIGGYIFGVLGRKPEVGDKVQIDNYSFEILKVTGYRVVRVKTTLLTENG